MIEIDTRREAAIAESYDIKSQLEKLEEECFELVEAIHLYQETANARTTAHLIEECVDVGIVLRRIERSLSSSSKHSELFRKMYEFKTIRQEIRIAIGDETFGGRHQEV